MPSGMLYSFFFLPSSEIVVSITASLCSDTVLDTVDTAEDKTNEPCLHRAYGCGKDALTKLNKGREKAVTDGTVAFASPACSA